jgi:hypothetical protein
MTPMKKSLNETDVRTVPHLDHSDEISGDEELLAKSNGGPPRTQASRSL